MLLLFEQNSTSLLLVNFISQAASYPHIEEMLEGIILTSPALRVKPAHAIVGVSGYTSLIRMWCLYVNYN